MEFTLTESHAGGTLFYSDNNLSCNPRQDIHIYKS